MNRYLTGSAERMCGVGIVTLFLASYTGNRVIGIGHGLLLLALIVFAVPFTVRSLREGTFLSQVRSILNRPYRMSVVCLGLMALVYLLSILWNWSSYEEPLRDLKKIRYLLIPLLLLVAIDRVSIANCRAWFKWCILLWLGSLIVATGYGLVTNFSSIIHSQKQGALDLSAGIFTLGRVTGIFGNVMSFAYSLQFSFLFLITLFLNRKNVELGFMKTTRGFGFAVCTGILFSGAALYFSYTRGAVLGVIVGLLLIVLLRKSWAILAVVLLIGILGAGYSYKGDKGFFRSMKNEDIRFIQWKTAGLTALKYPEFGVGYRNFEKRCAELKKEFGMPADFGAELDQWYNNHAHNNYLEAFASTGLLGGLFFIGFVGFWFAEVMRSKIARPYFVPVIAAFAISGFFENTFTDSEVLSVILLIYLVSQVLLDREERTSSDGGESKVSLP